MTQELAQPLESKPSPPASLEAKDLFKFVLDTRNFEISNFWQRSNYFLVLNTGLAIGFFNLKEGAALYPPLVAGLGVFVCFLWTRVALGSKFWQVHWEQKLAEVERMYLARGILDAEFCLFSQSMTEVKDEVRTTLESESHHGRIAKWIDSLVMRKPSVTLAMITLSATFGAAWAGVLIVSLIRLIR
ncbi:UNVERIFIED_ORG: hypothetical protein ABIC43_002777 [Variovorax guangxiensis]